MPVPYSSWRRGPGSKRRQRSEKNVARRLQHALFTPKMLCGARLYPLELTPNKKKGYICSKLLFSFPAWGTGDKSRERSGCFGIRLAKKGGPAAVVTANRSSKRRRWARAVESAPAANAHRRQSGSLAEKSTQSRAARRSAIFRTRAGKREASAGRFWKLINSGGVKISGRGPSWRNARCGSWFWPPHL